MQRNLYCLSILTLMLIGPQPRALAQSASAVDRLAQSSSVEAGTIASPPQLLLPLQAPRPLEFNVTGFGALGDGVHDDTAAIQKTIDAARVAGGGTVAFPAGRYRITSTLRISSNGVGLVGVGGGSVLAPQGNFDTLVYQSLSASTYIFYNRLSDLVVDETAKTGGSLLVGAYNAQFISERLTAFGGWSGMSFDNFNNVTLFHPRITDYRGGAGAHYVRLTGGIAGIGRSDVCSITRGVFGGAISLGMRGVDIDGFVHTVNGSSCHFVSIGGEALHARNTVGAPDVPAFITMDDFESDFAELEAVRLDAALRVSFINPQIHGSKTRCGIYVGGGAKTCSFTGGFVSGCQQAGIAIAGSDVTVTGMNFLWNSAPQPGAFPGILVGGTSRGTAVTGCRSGDAANPGFQRNGCQVDTGADDFVITGNNFRNNLNPGVLNGAGTGPTRLIANNI